MASDLGSSEWLQLWHIGTRSLTSITTCRAASMALHSLIGLNLVSIREVGEDVNNMVTAADTSGPTLLCDSAIFLMAHLLNARITEVPGASLLTSQHVIRWLFAKWNPGICISLQVPLSGGHK